MNKQEVVFFNKKINALTSEILQERVKGNGKIEKVTVRFYAGQGGDLHIKPIVIKQNGYREPMITYPENSSQYLSGDDDLFVLDTSIQVDNDDYIAIEAENVNSTFSYTAIVSVEINY